MVRRIRTVDAHVGGAPLRLIVEGCPRAVGATMLAKREWLRTHTDSLCRALVCEPRGHADMFGAVLTAPVSDDAHAGVLFMHDGGYPSMSGHGVIAAVTIALQRRLLPVSDRSAPVVLDTPAGEVRADPRLDDRGERVDAVSFLNVPSFVLHAGLSVSVGGRRIRADVAFGGAFYAIADGESVGVPVRATHLPELRRLGMQIREAVEAAVAIEHPAVPKLGGLGGTVITGLPEGDVSAIRSVAVLRSGQVSRSPSGTGTAALLAVVEAMGLLGDAQTFTSESIIGTTLTAAVADRINVGDRAAIVPRIDGSAWITGDHEFLIDDDDPLCAGFVIR